MRKLKTLDRVQVARRLGVSVRTLGRWRAAGTAPPELPQWPGRPRWSARDLAQWLRQRGGR